MVSRKRREKVMVLARSHQRHNPYWMIGMITAMVMVVALLLSACSTQGETAAPTAAPVLEPAAAAQTGGPQTGATVNEIVSNPDAYLNKMVTVSGEVNNVISPRAVTIGGEDFVGGGEVLIVNDRPLSEVVDGAIETTAFVRGILQATGEVRQFDIAAFEQELGVDLDDQLLQRFTGQPAIAAQALDLALRRPSSADTANAGNNVTVADIVSNPSAYLGQMVTVNGDAQDLIGTHAFRLDEEAVLAGGIDNDLLVVGAQENNPVIDNSFLNDRVQVTGTVRVFNITEVEQEVGYDLDDALFTDWADKAVLIAQTITPASDLPGGATTQQTPANNVAPEGNMPNALSVAEVTGNPQNYYGQTVTVRGGIEELLGPAAFRLDDDAILAGGIDNDLLVVSAQQNMPAFQDQWLNQQVVVMGTVRQFVQADIDREFDFLNLTPEIEVDYQNKPVLIAQSVSLVGAAAAPAANQTVPGAATGNVTVADIVGNPSAYVGQTVMVESEAEELIGTHAFRIDDEAVLAGGIDNDLLVVGAQQSNPVIDNSFLNDRVRVTGTVRMFDIAAVERELGYDLDDNLFTNWAGKPVLVATAVQPAE